MVIDLIATQNIFAKLLDSWICLHCEIRVHVSSAGTALRISRCLVTRLGRLYLTQGDGSFLHTGHKACHIASTGVMEKNIRKHA